MRAFWGPAAVPAVKPPNSSKLKCAGWGFKRGQRQGRRGPKHRGRTKSDCGASIHQLEVGCIASVLGGQLRGCSKRAVGLFLGCFGIPDGRIEWTCIQVCLMGPPYWPRFCPMGFLNSPHSPKGGPEKKYCARPNQLRGRSKGRLGPPEPHLSGPAPPRIRPERGNPLLWPLVTGTPQRAKKKSGEMAPNLNQRRGWPEGMPEGAWEPREPWDQPN